MKTLGIIALIMLAGCDSCPVNVGDRVYRVSDSKRGVVLNIGGGGRWTHNCRIIVRHDDKSYSHNTITRGEYVGHYKYTKNSPKICPIHRCIPSNGAGYSLYTNE